MPLSPTGHVPHAAKTLLGQLLPRYPRHPIQELHPHEPAGTVAQGHWRCSPGGVRGDDLWGSVPLSRV